MCHRIFVENNYPEYLNIDSKAAVIGVVLLVVVWAFAAVYVLAAVAAAGVVAGAYFVVGELYVLVHNQFWWVDSIIPPKNRTVS